MSESEEGRIRVAVYLRVSSDDQRDRETIRTQREAAERFLASHPEYETYDWYPDDGVSGTIPMAKRLHGSRLIADAHAKRFSKLIVYRASRLGREEADLFALYNLFEALDVELIGIMESLNDRMTFGFQSLMAAHYRRQFLADSARGMDRAAREGRFTGGIVPVGYVVVGKKETAKLMLDETPFWGDWSAVRLVRRIYDWLALDGKSCRWIAAELNRLGVPTAYDRVGRGVRGKKTQSLWRPGRIRNLVVNPVYKGVLSYGRRRSPNSKRREVIEASVDAIVAPELWEAAQRALAANRIAPKNTTRTYLLRGVMKCGLCGLAYCGAQGREGVWWYRCNGYMAERGGKDKQCRGRSIRNTDIENIVWRDIETLLRHPGELIRTLEAEAASKHDSAAAIQEAERQTLETALSEANAERDRTLTLFKRGHIDEDELDRDMDRLGEQVRGLERRLAALAEAEPEPEPVLTADLTSELLRRLDEGLNEEQRGEIVRALVKQITVHTMFNEKGKRDLRIVIEYRFGCSFDFRDTGSSQPPA